MIEKKNLHGKNIFLKTLCKNDINQDYLDWLNDHSINKYLEVRLNPPKSIDDLIFFVEEQRTSKNSILFGMFSYKNEFIGTLRLHNINNYHNFAYIGIMIGSKKSHGRGFGVEALNLISMYSKDILGLKVLYAGCYENNEPSIRCFTKSGFKTECIMKDYWFFNNTRISQLIFKKELI